MNIKNVSPDLILVTGPTRGGKSLWAEKIVLKSKQRSVHYLATLEIDKKDRDISKRIKIHQSRRPKTWTLHECNINLPLTLANISLSEPIIIDSLGGFVASHIESNDFEWYTQKSYLLKLITQRTAKSVVVSEETGWGVSPPTHIGNLFRDRLGSFSQELSSIASTTWLVVQGRAINLNDISIKI
ncbi:bifunctional adenosylcobinamide kinase/adenosylcobinamide-phosphate guanylyltransferase [Prochlorococcus sp. MIT 1300]|uniref:bifunctional adenosylcobinamide kinase/adenosylcobinamide-phosphate guanylyltransferase n=1 Tax=Prochlorococcus sp. MIT 1300 TaxID=3096218 RepID=UPI002A758DB0|nr:bifunctional adenosylcobinamide kinase/adenosylcobinamide-phosphate guanylyltransferase [Prochlorococcus sp. MIT 1300]